MPDHESIFTHADEDLEVFAYSTRPVWWRRCERLGGRLVRRGGRNGKDAWREYAIPRGFLVLRKPRRWGSAAQRRAAVVSMAKIHGAAV